MNCTSERGYNIGMDHMIWGARKETSGANAETLSWQQRAQTIGKLIAAGFCSRIFLSNDWYFDVSMAGTGLMQVMEEMNPDGMLFNTRHTIPYLKQIGVTDQEIRTITVENPRGFFGGART
jgi:predicted metal-dependent phosphotriesterase family hydrolase